jgi:hypothetical protein
VLAAGRGLFQLGRWVFLTRRPVQGRRVLWLRFGAQLVLLVGVALATLAAAWLVLHGAGGAIRLPPSRPTPTCST